MSELHTKSMCRSRGMTAHALPAAGICFSRAFFSSSCVPLIKSCRTWPVVSSSRTVEQLMLLMPSQGFGSRSLLVYFAIDSRKFRKIDRNRGLKKKALRDRGTAALFSAYAHGDCSYVVRPPSENRLVDLRKKAGSRSSPPEVCSERNPR